MQGEGKCGTCGTNPCGVVEILQGYMKTFYVNLLFEDTQQPFDLSNVDTAGGKLAAAFPGANGTPVQVVSGSPGEVQIIGAPGAGLIAVTLSAAKSALVALNPAQPELQDLQVEVTIGSGGNASSPQGTVGFRIPAVLDVKLPPYGVITP